MTTSELIMAKTQLHKKQQAFKLFQQARAEPLKNNLTDIKQPKDETTRTPGFRWPPPPTDESRKPHKVRPPAPGRNKATPGKPAEGITPQATEKAVQEETSKKATVGK